MSDRVVVHTPAQHQRQAIEAERRLEISRQRATFRHAAKGLVAWRRGEPCTEPAYFDAIAARLELWATDPDQPLTLFEEPS